MRFNQQKSFKYFSPNIFCIVDDTIPKKKNLMENSNRKLKFETNHDRPK